MKIEDNETTSLTIRNNYGVYTITTNAIDMDMIEILQELVVPALRACGYTDKTIHEFIDVDF